MLTNKKKLMQNASQKYKNLTLFKTKMAEIDTPFMTKTPENHTLGCRIYLYRPYREYPLPEVDRNGTWNMDEKCGSPARMQKR